MSASTDKVAATGLVDQAITLSANFHGSANAGLVADAATRARAYLDGLGYGWPEAGSDDAGSWRSSPDLYASLDAIAPVPAGLSASGNAPAPPPGIGSQLLGAINQSSVTIKTALGLGGGAVTAGASSFGAQLGGSLSSGVASVSSSLSKAAGDVSSAANNFAKGAGVGAGVGSVVVLVALVVGGLLIVKVL